MNNTPAILRSLIIYAVIVPLAVFIGYLASDPLQRSSFAYYGILALVLIFPILLRYYHPLLILSWNCSMTLFFLPGRPTLWLTMSAAGLCILLLQRAMGAVRHVNGASPVTWSLICLTGVILFTAKMTGLGLRSMGSSDVYGGRHYVYLLGAIVGYFAISGLRIPPERANLYVGLFFLSGLTASIGDLIPVIPGPLRIIFWFFPANSYYFGNEMAGVRGMRLGGAMATSLALYSFMMAKYGIRGIFLSGKKWRIMVFLLSLVFALLSGFRSHLIIVTLIFAVQFYLEGMQRTKLLPIFAFCGISMAVLIIPFVSHLPFAAQRALSFLPLQIDSVARQDAEGTWEWRMEMWKSLLPQIPQHLLLGKGFAVSKMDYDLLSGSDAAIHVGSSFAENQYMALAGGYHNGPLSVILGFGIWGCIAMIWFWVASLQTLYRNYRYGDPALRTVNMFLLIAFSARILMFAAIDGDMVNYCGLLGLGVSLNGGACPPVPQSAPAVNKLQPVTDIRAHLQPTFRRPNLRG
jgi:hypothetical protein